MVQAPAPAVTDPNGEAILLVAAGLGVLFLLHRRPAPSPAAVVKG